MKKKIHLKLQHLKAKIVWLLLFFISFAALNESAQAQVPTISSFTPSRAKPGDLVTLTGTNFNTTPGNNVVFFGATRAIVTVATATSLTVTVPLGATYAPITLLNIVNSLTANSLTNFNPTYNPAKTNITSTDFNAKQDLNITVSSVAVAFGDLDGDGKSDLAVVNGNTVSVFLNTSSSGAVSFATKVDFLVGYTGSYPYYIAIGDLDGDGKPDLVVPNTYGTSVSILRNTSSSLGSISFATKVDVGAYGAGPRSLAIGDLDGDGKLDLVMANYTNNNITVLNNRSTIGNITTSSFVLTTTLASTGTGPYSVAIGDLDGDGKPDLAVTNLATGINNVSVFRNTSSGGGTTFAAKVDFATGTSPKTVVIGDLDGDGLLDLAVANAGTNTVSVLRNTSSIGNISFDTKADFTVGTGTASAPRSVAIGDFDGDGKPDLAVANNFNSTTANVSILRNTGTSGVSFTSASFAAHLDFNTAPYASSVAIGDLDGDGKPDFAVANSYATSPLSVFRNADITTTPVMLVSYEAKLNPVGTVQLKWLTASELNNSYFEILSSTDGKNFTAIGKVDGAGNSNQENRYNFIDKSPLKGANYYQLIQYDKDGKKTDLGIRSVNVSIKGNDVIVYPNPSHGLVNLNFEANSYQRLELMDMTGKVLITRPIGKRESTVSFDISTLAVGIYNVRLTGEGSLTNKQIVKQ
jgi:hypothetical protein